MLRVQDGGYVREYPKPDEDADVYNNDGLANRALKCQTLYEQMSASGRVT